MRRVLLLGILAISLFSACGGGGSGIESGFDEVILLGVVEDGPLSGARVFLRDIATGETARYCGASGVGRCETVTDEDGRFSLRVSSLALEHPLELFTNGGFDRRTGVDFAGMPMRAPLELFRHRLDQIRVTPLTSVLSGRLKTGALSELAAEEIAVELGLPLGSDLGAPIGEASALLRSALVLTAMAIELAEGGDSDPFSSLGARMNGAFPLLIDHEGRPDPETLFEWGFDEKAIARLVTLEQELREGEGSLCERFRKALLSAALFRTVELMLGEDDGIDLEHPFLRPNLSLLAEKILIAAGDTPLPVRGIPPGRIARYALFTYNLTSFEALSADPELFSQTIQSLQSDERIAELAALRTRYAVSVPLLDHEMPGADNQRRIDYFYNSDASPFYQAERLLAYVFDDQIRDPLLVQIASGKADVGLIADALTIIETQVHLSEFKARGYRGVGDALVRYGRKSEALEVLRQAEHFAIRFTQNKGSNLTTADAQFLQGVGSSLRKAGDGAGAQRMSAYLESFLPHLDTPALYGRVIVGTWQLADEYIAAGEEGSALPLVLSMEDLAAQTPPNVFSWGRTYRARVLYLLETAKRFATLGLDEDVVGVWERVRQIRAADGMENLTEGDTWGYIPDFVELLYQIGRREEALTLAGQIPESHSARGKAIKLIATIEAIDGNLPAALSIIEAHFTDPIDKIEALTYFALNKSSEYIALALIRREALETAREALDIAAALPDEIQTATERARYQQVIQRGYVKIADLYHLVGDDASAFEMLVKAEVVAATMLGLQNEVDSLIDILIGYHQIGEEHIADQLLFDAAEALAGAQDVSAFDLANLYHRLLGTSLDIGRSEATAQILPKYLAVVRTIFDPWTIYSGNERDRQLRRQVEHLIRAARYSRQIHHRIGARDLLLEASQLARLISVEKDRVALFVGPLPGGAESVVSGLAIAGFFDEALAMAEQRDEYGRLTLTVPGRNQGLLAIARVYAQRDDFPGTKVASIDFDGDGRPYFFHPLASPEEIVASGLVLDDDSDGDGIPDIFDRRPLFADPHAWP